MSRANHPLFEAVQPERRWTGPLAKLDLRLSQEAKEIDRGHQDELARKQARLHEKDWAWRVLPGGALVAKRIRRDLDYRMEVRIARNEKPADEAAQARWRAEIETFLRHFTIRALDGETPCRHPGRDMIELPSEMADDDKAAVRYVELRRGEVKVGKAICHSCLEGTGEIVVIDWWSSGGIEGQRCQSCAMVKGEVTV